MKKVIAFSLALTFASPAVASCFIAPSWDIGETVVTLHQSPAGPVTGYLAPDVPVIVTNTAPPWAYVVSPDPCCGEIAGWVWIRSVPAQCLPPPPCCITAPERHIYVKPQPYIQPEQPHEQPHEQLPEAPMPDYAPPK